MIASNFSPAILRFESVDSTNRAAQEAIRNGAKEGTVIVAEMQTAGRGRGKRNWHSPKGGLYLTAILKPRASKHSTDLSILAGVALAQAVNTLLPKQKDVSVKWPNDCLVDWKKVGGVLCELLGEEYLNYCLVGIGLNVNIPEEALEAFKANPFSVTSFLMESAGGHFDLEKVLGVVLKKLFTLYALYQAQGFEPIQYLWERNCSFIGKKIELRESGWREEEKNRRKLGVAVGTCLGIDQSGALVLSNSRGERHQYFSGEITCYWP